MKRKIKLADGREVWPKYPRWREMGMKPRANRSRRHRGKMRLRYNPLYATDRAPTSRIDPKPSVAFEPRRATQIEVAVITGHALARFDQ